jgi:two-component system phosphate regulon sensor histidine kinase PhoR
VLILINITLDLNKLMKTKNLNSIIILGLIAIVGILIAQLLWTKEAFSLEEKKFTQKVHVALLEVVKKLYEGGNSELPLENPINKIANDYYIVNVENEFDAEILEFYLKSEFKKFNLNTDFEYAMYNCQSDEMVYGNYISLGQKESIDAKNIYFPKHKNLVYYFAVRFPNETNYLFSSLRFWFILSFALLIILFVYVYSIYTIIQQKKYSESQRDFINNMTHEFKTPLSSILIASQYLKKQDVIIADEKLLKYNQLIIEQSNKLNEHIEKILSVAKSDNTSLKINKETVLLKPLLTNVSESLQLKYPELIVTLNVNPELTIQADNYHFTNILYNIIDNSVKYCDCDPIVEISIVSDSKKLLLIFKDNGIGIKEENSKFMFDKFYRENNLKLNEVTGFGLGLFYVKKICTQHGWKISAKNNLDKGITLAIEIPLNKK